MKINVSKYKVNPTELGIFLRSYRDQHGMTAAQMAEEMGVEVSTIGKIETGRRRLTERMLEKLEAFLMLAPKEVRKFEKAVKLSNTQFNFDLQDYPNLRPLFASLKENFGKLSEAKVKSLIKIVEK